ncbi:MAG: right-handed parallel beta-helix repeat-containing protein, partial [Planctomycetes bacterium]|nr:right-handed parallel beta-helix repeat-containing protein [Planctomycetota bacterium]
PQSAWPTLGFALQQAAILGGGNIWVSAGTYAEGGLVVPPDVRIYAGFDGDCDLTTFDPNVHEAVVMGSGPSPVMTLNQSTDDTAVLVGLHINGGGTAEACVEVNQRACQLLRVSGSDGVRGFKLRSNLIVEKVGIQLVDCTLSGCQVGGISIDGAFDLFANHCAFTNNLQEGITADDLLALGSKVSTLSISNCLFEGNGSEGLDVDLVAYPSLSTGGWQILLTNNEFIRNRLDGCLIDCDYETSPGWIAQIEIQGCVARANGSAGFHLDLDAQSSALLHRCRSSNNGTDGFLVTSETAPGMATASACAFLGNQAMGVRSSLGNVGVVLSHCVLSGNAQGGFASTSNRGSVASSVAFLQTDAWQNVETTHVHDQATFDPELFLSAPSGWAQTIGMFGEQIRLEGGITLNPGDTVEFEGDGVSRNVIGQVGNVLDLSPRPEAMRFPGQLALWPGPNVDTDWTPGPLSPLYEAGLGPLGGPFPHAGPAGAIVNGAPGS